MHDSSGYPRGLKCDEISLGACLCAIADTLDAITSDRPYRAEQTLAAPHKEIKKWSGRQFDPKAIEIFVTMPDSIWADLRREIDTQSYGFAYPQKPAKRPAGV